MVDLLGRELEVAQKLWLAIPEYLPNGWVNPHWIEVADWNLRLQRRHGVHSPSWRDLRESQREDEATQLNLDEAELARMYGMEP